jgi:hypothetical protein
MPVWAERWGILAWAGRWGMPPWGHRLPAPVRVALFIRDRWLQPEASVPAPRLPCPARHRQRMRPQHQPGITRTTVRGKVVRYLTVWRNMTHWCGTTPTGMGLISE